MANTTAAANEILLSDRGNGNALQELVPTATRACPGEALGSLTAAEHPSILPLKEHLATGSLDELVGLSGTPELLQEA